MLLTATPASDVLSLTSYVRNAKHSDGSGLDDTTLVGQKGGSTRRNVAGAVHVAGLVVRTRLLYCQHV